MKMPILAGLLLATTLSMTVVYADDSQAPAMPPASGSTDASVSGTPTVSGSGTLSGTQDMSGSNTVMSGSGEAQPSQ